MQNEPGPNVPFPPMEAELVSELPERDGWRYEPKWDGFRGVLENDGGDLALWSRNGRPLLRYFPELRPLGELLPKHSALDGEIVISRNGALDFDAKQLGLPYLPGSRDGVVKVKPHKTADCVVAGLRWKAGGRDTIATLLLGLYADDGRLDYVGSCAIGARNQAEIAEKVLPLLDEKSERRFSEPNRWGTNGLEEAALRTELVVEVRYDKLEKSRFRHGTKLIRFRPDKDPDQCTWREVRPARRPDDLAVEDLLA